MPRETPLTLSVQNRDLTYSTITTSLTYEEMIAILKRVNKFDRDGRFAADLVSQGTGHGRSLSERQQFWAYTLAEKHKNDIIVVEQKPAEYGPFPTILEFLKRADDFRKSGAELTFKNLMPGMPGLSNDGTVKIVKAGNMGFWKGNYWISNGAGHGNPDAPNILYGRVTPEGKLVQHRDKILPDGILAMFDEMEADPIAFVTKYGKQSGHCVFCSMPLDDEVSVAFGYGPVCAKNYGLPHGKKALAIMTTAQLEVARKNGKRRATARNIRHGKYR